ncbi:MAG: hypothetical protein H6605_02310 [Flavobacteriales bacterium]|nr:hypothetical protein [Flavobacteriales bacterium]
MKSKAYYILLIAGLVISQLSVAQAPEGFNYQAVVRDGTGKVINKGNVGVRFTIHQTTLVGSTVYQERQALITNEYGLISAVIGKGSALMGQFDNILWGMDKYFLQVEIDPAGGSNYTDMGASQLMSVPYALNAKVAKSIEGGIQMDWTKAGNDIYNNNKGNVGIGSMGTMYKLSVRDSIGTSGIMNIENADSNGFAGIYFQSGVDRRGWIGHFGTNGWDKNNSFQIGSRDSTNLTLSTGPKSRLTIDGIDGNVGIGIDTPKYKLAVNGDIAMTHNWALVSQNYDGSPSIYLWPRYGSTNKTFFNYGEGGFDIRNNASNVTMRMDDVGNVSVGPYSPLAKFQVDGESTNYAMRVRVDGGTRFTVDGNGGTAIGTLTTPPANGLYVYGDVGLGTTTPAAKLDVRGDIYSSGNVGLGTTTPAAKLDVKGGILVSGNSGFGTTTPSDRIHVVGAFRMTGGTGWLNTSADNSQGNASFGGTAYGNVKLTVSSNQTFGLYLNGASAGTALYVIGTAGITGNLSKGGGSFKIDHPLDPANKFLYHSFVESPDMMNIYNGNITTDANGTAVVKMPDYFEALNMEFRYQLTVIGTFAQAIVAEELSNNQFVIKTNQPNIKVSWQVTGIRHDAFANKNRIPGEVEKTGKEKGKYIHPEAFGLTEDMRIDLTEKVTETIAPIKETR